MPSRSRLTAARPLPRRRRGTSPATDPRRAPGRGRPGPASVQAVARSRRMLARREPALRRSHAVLSRLVVPAPALIVTGDRADRVTAVGDLEVAAVVTLWWLGALGEGFEVPDPEPKEQLVVPGASRAPATHQPEVPRASVRFDANASHVRE